ncbi:MAG: alpha-hydroxy acid oxidase [Chloroflexota bacterium]
MLLNLYDYKAAAAEKMDPPAYAYYAGGVAENIARDGNRQAFDQLRLRPKMLRNVSQISTECEIMGIKTEAPIMIAPAAMHKLAHPDGEMGTARAAQRAGIIQVLSTMSTVSVEDVARVGHNLWFQLYVFRDRAISEQIVARAEASGAQALVVTLDVPTPGLRENLIRAGFTSTSQYDFPNFASETSSKDGRVMHHAANTFDPSLSWKDIEWLASLTRLPIWVKGILRGDDAIMALDHGVKGIMVSNHGGRQLDTAIAPIDALPEVAAAVDGRCELIIDGGIRRGTDIIKAIALGAKAVMIGRPPLWGLAVDGEEGAYNVLKLLIDELENGMMQCGCPRLSDIGRDLVV